MDWLKDDRLVQTLRRLLAWRKLLSRFALLAAGYCVLGMPLFVASMVTLLPETAHAADGQCVWEGGPGTPTYASCAQEDCIGAGGTAQCTEPVVAPPPGVSLANVDDQSFTYGACDDEAPTIGAAVRWCNVKGGQWNAAGQCTGLPAPFDTGGPNSEDLAIQIGNEREAIGGTCPRARQTDSGWGFTDSGGACGGGPAYKNNQQISDARLRVYGPPECGNGTTRIILTKLRQLKCQNGLQRTLPNGDLQCFVPPETCVGCGNPVSPVTGAKLEDKIDYRAGGAGGIEFGHYYNSQGPFRLPGLGGYPPGFSDYWQFSYDRRLTPIAGNSQLGAIVKREDGTIEDFDGSGKEILNRGGGPGIV